MKAVGILTCAFLMVFVTACGPGDPPESIRYGRKDTGAGGASNVTSGTGGSGAAVPPPKGGAGAPPTSREAGVEVGSYSEELVEADPAPLPIAGGTLAITALGTRAAISDPDGDQVVVVDLVSMKVVNVVPLAIGDDPGRLVEDAAGRVHVALRAGRGVAVIDPTAGVPVGRLPVCPLPRGLAYDYPSDTIHVACAGGELVSYTASSGNLLRRLRLDRDLRDVVVDGARLLVSRFRSAELLVVEADGTISDRLIPPSTTDRASLMKPAVAWRTIPAPGGGAFMVHQMMAMSPINTSGGGYGGQCRKIVTTAVSYLRTDRGGWMVDGIPTVLPIDVAATANALRVAVPGAARTAEQNFGGSMQFVVFAPPSDSARTNLSPCGGAVPMPPFVDGEPQPVGRVVAVAYDPSGRLALQTRVPAMFHLGSRAVLLPGRARKHTGHELFHLATAGGIACASCHPEGRDDGQVWNFAGMGPRRTQSLAGGIAGTEPLHWAGDMTSFATLAADVFGSRMSGPRVSFEHTNSLKNWIDKIPRMQGPAADDASAAERGRTLFNDAVVGCATCHSGARFTNNQTMAVNTGGSFQVPSLLGLAWRAPYMHEGCAATLSDRFGACGGGDAHGRTSQLTAEQRTDLVAYLETL
ncbi:MAG TPA: cytochrome c [Polyangiaceae bacterium]|nr:cytochrome c [Polyangiaceae bacterium]